MKRWFVAALVLAVMQASAAWAWIPIGTTAESGGVLFFARNGNPDAELQLYDDAGAPLYSTKFVWASYAAGPVASLFPDATEWYFSAHVYDTEDPTASPSFWSIKSPYRSNIIEEVLGGTIQSVSFQKIGETWNFAADLLCEGGVTLPDETEQPLSSYGMSNKFRLEGTLTYSGSPAPGGRVGDFFKGSMVLSIQPIPEPVFFQMGALMGLSGLGLLRLRRKA